MPNQEYAPLEVKNECLETVGKSGYVPFTNVHCGPPKSAQKLNVLKNGMIPYLIYPPGVPNQEFAPLEVKNEITGTVGKSWSLSGQVLCNFCSEHPRDFILVSIPRFLCMGKSIGTIFRHLRLA